MRYPYRSKPGIFNRAIPGLAGLFAPLPKDSLASGDKGHECGISGPRSRPLDIFGRTLLHRPVRPNLVQRHVATTRTTQDSRAKSHRTTVPGRPGRPTARPRGTDTTNCRQALFLECRVEATPT